MKTLLSRNTAWLLVLTFCFTQVVPAGLAAPNLNELSKETGVSATVDPLAEGAKKLSEVPQQIKIPAADSIAFLLGDSGISKSESPLSPETGEGTTMTTVTTVTVVEDEAVTQEETDSTPSAVAPDQNKQPTPKPAILLPYESLKKAPPQEQEKELPGDFKDYEKIPLNVQAYIEELTKQLGDGFSVTAELQEDGTYLVRVGRVNPCASGVNCAEGVLAPGSFLSLEFRVTARGEFLRDSIKANFKGMDVVDGALLYAAMEYLYPLPRMRLVCGADGCFTPFRVNGEAWKAMTGTVITQVEGDGTTHFVLPQEPLNRRFFQASRGRDGRLIIKNEIPLMVFFFVRSLQNQLGSGFEVTVTPDTDNEGIFMISVEDKVYANVHLSIAAGLLQQMNIRIDEAGNMRSVNAVYYGIQALSAKLLFNGMKLLQPGATDEDALALMARIHVDSVEPDLSGAIHLDLNGSYYELSHDPSVPGGAVLENELPPAAQALVEQLRTQLPGFTVRAIVLGSGDGRVGYEIQITDAKEYLKDPTSGLHRMSFFVLANGRIDANSVRVGYYSPNGAIKLDAKLLLDALIVLDQGLVEIVTIVSDPTRELIPVEKDPNPKGPLFVEPLIIDKMSRLIVQLTQTTVTQVNPDGAILFTLAGVNYFAYRDEVGNVIVDLVLSPDMPTVAYPLVEKPAPARIIPE